uniref:Trafficking protein particle complex subunit 8 n=1 Tax=Globisporangium ultimum (strain ATCC 200006 / CBS 805.95 / DAOM BR144) TaxID=431595 RepID=K3WUK9_GLOUD
MESMERWVQETFAPIVLTCTTPEVERISHKNNLSFADLLNGFSMLTHTDTPIRSVNHQYTLPNFNFRFLAATQFGTLGLQDATRLINEDVMRNPPTSISSSANNGSSNNPAMIDLDIPKVTSVDDVPAYLRAIGVTSADTNHTNTDPLPWYKEFRRTLLDTFRCEEYSMMCHPAVMLLVVSSTDGNPRNCFEELAATRNLPPVFLQGLYDPNIPKYFLVVHDNVEAEGTSIDPDAILQSLQIPVTTGAVLRVNSLPAEHANPLNASRWGSHPYVRRPLFPGNVGSFPPVTDTLGGLLSSDDLTRIGSFVRKFGLTFVLPALEARIYQLNEIVSAMKKGVKNVFKSWLRKPKDLSARTTSANSAVTYRCDAIESQTRLLADTAFMVRDYELALQMYRLVRDDYKSDKSTFHCANANEMIALTLLLTKGSPMQMTNALDMAIATYVKGNNLATARLAVRAAVHAGEIYNTLSHSGLFTDYMDSASAALIRGSTMEQGICSAVLMERAALCDIQSRQPKFRKYGFRMVMAGHVYDSLGHARHSARCYALARAVYDCSGWFQVEDHINFTLAQQANRLSDPIASINLFLKLIGTGRNSASQQEALLYEFGLIVKEFLATSSDAPGSAISISREGPILINTGSASGPHAKKLLVKDLVMPELEDKSTVVFSPVNAFGINREIDGNYSNAERWKELEQMIEKQNQVHQYALSDDAAAAARDGSRRNQNVWLHQPSLFFNVRKKNGQLKKPENYALGEKIYVEFIMKNALSCAVDVEDIHLFGKFEPASSENGGEAIDVPTAAFAEATAGQDEHIVVDRVNLQLLPCSEERVRLAVTPQSRGVLRLVGVRWSICGGDVHGEHAFDIPGPLLQDTRANREARARAPNTSLIANIVGAMPWLGVQIESTPAEAYVGEIIKMNVMLMNGGTAELADLQVSCSDLQLCVSPDGSAKREKLAQYIGSNGEVVDLRDVRLAPGESKKVVVWARGLVPGRQQPRFVFRYKKSSDDASSLAAPNSSNGLFRMVRLSFDLNLLPCVDVSYSVEPSFSASGEYILGVTVKNQRRDGNVDHQEPVRMEQLMCVSNSWTIERFPEAGNALAVRESTQLGFLEASTTYFRMIPRVDPASSTSVFDASPVQLQRSQDASLHDHIGVLPVEQFLCVENAHELCRIANQSGPDGNDDSKRGGGFRTIQSVRRENKALKSLQNKGEDDNDANGGQAKKDPQPTSKDALAFPSDVDGHLVLVWSTGSDVRQLAIGQTNLTSIKVRSPLRANVCPLAVTLQYEDSISLRPASESSSIPGLSFAELDITMTIRNGLTTSSAPIDFTVEMLHPGEAKPTSGGRQGSFPFAADSTNSAASPHFFWTGVTKKKIVDFAPSAQATIQLRACFMSSGIYDLNRFRFLIHPAGNSAINGGGMPMAPAVFHFPVEYLVYVKLSSAAGAAVAACTTSEHLNGVVAANEHGEELFA